MADPTRDSDDRFPGFRKPPPLPPQVAVSYVMPVLNEAGYLRAAVESVLAQDYDGEAEVVLALGTSTDGTDRVAADLAAQDERIRVVRNPDDVIPAGLNAAIRASRHPVIVRVDAHAELPPRYTERAVARLRSSGAANVGGVMLARGTSTVQRAIARAYNSPFGLGGGVFHHGSQEQPADSVYLGVFRREVLLEVGLYDQTVWRGEDWEVNSRIRAAGYLVLFVPALQVVYRPRTSLRSLGRQMYATGVWRGHLTRRQHGGPLRYFPPPVVTLVVGTSAVCALLRAGGVLRGRAARIASVAHLGTAGYAIGVSAVGVTALGGRTVVDRVTNVPVLAVMHLSWGWGFCRGFVGGASGAWDRSRVTR